jgi:hypothetical protein
MSSNFDLDHEYLKETVCYPLTQALARLAAEQPEDPVEFLGNYLLKYVENESRIQQRKDFQDSILDIEADKEHPIIATESKQV